MAVRVTELRGQDFSGGKPVKRYIFRDLDDALAVDARLQTFATGEIGLEYGGLPIDLSGRTIQELGGKEWYVTIPYSARAGNIVQPGAGAATTQASQQGGANGRDQPVMRNISYSVRGGTQKITQSRNTLARAIVAGATGAARNFRGAIGVSKDKDQWKVDGCDVLSGEVQWSYTAQIPDAAFNGAYATVVENLLCSPNYRRHCKNAAPFFGYAAGEVLLVGFDVSELEASGYRKMKFDFAVKRNRAEIIFSASPELKLTSVVGWSYVWTTYKPQTQDVGGGKKRTVMVPFEAFEEEVYEDGDYSALQLETYRVTL